MQPSNPNQFTEKAWQAIARTPDIAKQARHQQLESEHLLQSLLEQEGLATTILHEVGVNVRRLQDRTAAFLQNQPKVRGSQESLYLGSRCDSFSLNR